MCTLICIKTHDFIDQVQCLIDDLIACICRSFSIGQVKIVFREIILPHSSC